MKKDYKVFMYSDRYKSDSNGWWYIIAILCFFGMMAALFSCSISKKTDKAYKAIEKYQPLKVADTSRLASRFKSTFKPQPTKVIQGKTITRTVVKENTVKVKTLQDRIDSLLDDANFSKELLSSVPKIDSLKAAIRKQVLKECKPTEIVIDNSTTDTVFQDAPEITAALWLAQNQQKELTTANEGLQATVADNKEKMRSLKWTFFNLFSFWYLDLALVLLVGGFIYLKVKRIL